MATTRRHRRQRIIWSAVAVLVAAIVFVKIKDNFHEETSAHNHEAGHGINHLLPLSMVDVSAIKIHIDDATVQFERDGENSWFLHQPNDAQHHKHADDTETATHTHDEAHHDEAHSHTSNQVEAKRISYALAALDRAKIKREFDSTIDSAEYGFKQSRFRIEIFNDDPDHPITTYIVGELAPDTLSRYVWRTDTSSALTVADYQIKNLTDLAESFGKTAGF